MNKDLDSKIVMPVFSPQLKAIIESHYSNHSLSSPLKQATTALLNTKNIEISDTSYIAKAISSSIGGISSANILASNLYGTSFVLNSMNGVAQKYIEISNLHAGNLILNMPNLKLDFSDEIKAMIHAFSELPTLKSDFRMDLLSQSIQNSLLSVSKQDSETIDKKFNETMTTLGKSNPESLIKHHDKNNDTNNVRSAKNYIVNRNKTAKDYTKYTFKKDVDEYVQRANSSDLPQKSFTSFITNVVFIIEILKAPQEVYNLLIWVQDIISKILN